MPLPPGTRLGPYQLEALIGAGGMGDVYRAQDTRLDRSVAVKVLPPALSKDPNFRRRFEREARAASRLNHPHVCVLYDVGQHDDVDYVVMELLEGETLAARLKNGTLDFSQVLDHALAMLSALKEIHRRGLVHGDLKPSNLFITEHGIKVLDFGVARPQRGQDADETETANIVGTPHYMAPEVIQGQPADARADLFAAGVIVFEMLTGERPFKGRTPAEAIQSIVHDRPPVLTGSSAIVAADRVVHKALEKNREGRYESAQAMAQDLRSLLPLAGDVPSGATARTITRLIVLPFRMLRPDPDTEFLSFSLSDAVTASLNGLESLVVRSSAAASRFAGDTVDLRLLAEEANVDVALTGTLLRAGDAVRATAQLLTVPDGTVLWTHRTQVSMGDLFQLQDELARHIVESLSIPLSARESDRLGRDLPKSARAYEYFLRANQLNYEQRQWEVARQLYEQCLELDPEYAPALARLGGIHRNMAKWSIEEPEANQTRAEQALAKALSLNADIGVAHKIFALLDSDRGRATQAMQRLLSRLSEQPADPELYAGLVLACRYCGLLEASIAATQRARRLDPKLRTSVHHTLFMQGRYQEAIDSDDHESQLVTSFSLQMLGQVHEAQSLLRRVEAKLRPAETSRSGLFDLVHTSLLAANDDVNGFRESLHPFVTGFPDVEAVFYVARQCARLGELDTSMSLLEQATAGGFHCQPILASDPWLDPIRHVPAFRHVLERVEHEWRHALAAFLDASGERLLGMSVNA